MRTIETSTASAGVDQRGYRAHSHGAALVALFVALAAITATVVLSWQGSTSHRAPALTRVVGPDTFVGSVYDEQVPAAADPLRKGSVYRQQVPTAPNSPGAGSVIRQQEPPYLPMEGMQTEPIPPLAGNVFHEQVPPYLPMGNAESDVRGLDDDSAALTAGRHGSSK